MRSARCTALICGMSPSGAAAHDRAGSDDRPRQATRPQRRLGFVLRLLVRIHPAGLTAVVQLEHGPGRATRHERGAHVDEALQLPAFRRDFGNVIGAKSVDEARAIERSREARVRCRVDDHARLALHTLTNERLEPHSRLRHVAEHGSDSRDERTQPARHVPPAKLAANEGKRLEARIVPEHLVQHAFAHQSGRACDEELVRGSHHASTATPVQCAPKP